MQGSLELVVRLIPPFQRVPRGMAEIEESRCFDTREIGILVAASKSRVHHMRCFSTSNPC